MLNAVICLSFICLILGIMCVFLYVAFIQQGLASVQNEYRIQATLGRIEHLIRRIEFVTIELELDNDGEFDDPGFDPPQDWTPEMDDV